MGRHSRVLFSKKTLQTILRCSLPAIAKGFDKIPNNT